MDTDGVEPPRRQENQRMEPQINADGRRGGEAHTEARRHGGAEGELATKRHKRHRREQRGSRGDAEIAEEESKPQIDADGRRGGEAHTETRRHGGAEGN